MKSPQRQGFILSAICLIGCLSITCVLATPSLEKWAVIASPFERTRVLRTELASASAVDYPELFAQAQTLPAARKAECLPLLMSYWGEKDASTAFASCAALQPIYAQRNLWYPLFSAWAQREPKAAFTTLLSARGRPFFSQALLGFAQGYADKAPAETFSFFIEQRRLYPWLHSYRSDVLETIVAAWAKRDTAAALRAASAHQKNSRDYIDLSDLLGMWFLEQPDTLQRALSAIPPRERTSLLYDLARCPRIPLAQIPALISLWERLGGDDADSIIGQFFMRRAERDWKATLPLVLELRSKKARNDAMESIFQIYGSKDFDAAWTAAVALTDNDLRAHAFAGLLRNQIESKRLPQYLSQIVQIDNPSLRRQLMGALGRSYLSSGGDVDALMRPLADPARQREMLLSMVLDSNSWRGLYLRDKKAQERMRIWAMILPPSQARINLLKGTLTDKASLADIQVTLDRMTPGEAQYLLRSFNDYNDAPWGEYMDPAKISTLPEGLLRDFLTQEISKKMTNADPKATYEWLCTLPPGSARDKTYNKYLQQLASSQNLEAFLYAVKNPPENCEISPMYYAGMVQNIAKTDPAQALAWVLAQPDEAVRSKALAGLSAAWDVKQPAAFFAQMKELEAQVDTQWAVLVFLWEWNSKDSKGAVQWLQQAAQTDPDMAGRAVPTIFDAWVGQDAMAATQWLNTLPNGDLRNKAIESLVNSWESGKSPQETLAWVMTVPPDSGEATIRQDMLENLVSEVKRRDPVAAKALLDDPQLTDSERAAMQKALMRVGY